MQVQNAMSAMGQKLTFPTSITSSACNNIEDGTARLRAPGYYLLLVPDCHD